MLCICVFSSGCGVSLFSDQVLEVHFCLLFHSNQHFSGAYPQLDFLSGSCYCGMKSGVQIIMGNLYYITV